MPSDSGVAGNNDSISLTNEIQAKMPLKGIFRQQNRPDGAKKNIKIKPD